MGLKSYWNLKHYLFLEAGSVPKGYSWGWLSIDTVSQKRINTIENHKILHKFRVRLKAPKLKTPKTQNTENQNAETINRRIKNAENSKCKLHTFYEKIFLKKISLRVGSHLCPLIMMSIYVVYMCISEYLYWLDTLYMIVLWLFMF